MASLDCLEVPKYMEKNAALSERSERRRSVSIGCQTNLQEGQAKDKVFENVEKKSCTSIACQANTDEATEESLDKDSDEACFDEEEGCSSGSGKSYDSDEFAVHHNFSLPHLELKESLLKLHVGKGNLYHTRTSSWSRRKARACAAYKVFKIKRWQLTDVNLVFDPLCNAKSSRAFSNEQLLWPKFTASPEEKINVKSSSVDGILAANRNKLKYLLTLDELLPDLGGPFVNLHENMEMILKKMVTRAMTDLPGPACKPFYNLIYALVNTFVRTECKERIFEVTFQNLFQKFVSCIAACLNESSVECDITMDGITLDQLHLNFGNDVKPLTISSVPDLYIYQKTYSSFSKRAIAVVEVKGKHGEHVLHSDDEDEGGNEFTDLGMIEEEQSDEELAVVEKIVKAKHKYMKKLTPQKRRRLGKFLPQLIGEMLCCNGCRKLINIKTDDPGYSFGIGVIGFDVYFVTMVASDGQNVREVFDKSNVCYHVFVTKPFNMRFKAERRIVMKVLAAGFFVDQRILSFCTPQSIDDTNFSGLNINA